MVELTKLNGDRFYLNENWIEALESMPDTTITLSSGNKFVVLEALEAVMEKIVAWQARVPKPSKVKAQHRITRKG